MSYFQGEKYSLFFYVIWDIDNKYPKWDPIDYKFQDAQFFSMVRKLLLERLEPKHDLMDEHLTIADIT